MVKTLVAVSIGLGFAVLVSQAAVAREATDADQVRSILSEYKQASLAEGPSKTLEGNVFSQNRQLDISLLESANYPTSDLQVYISSKQEMERSSLIYVANSPIQMVCMAEWAIFDAAAAYLRRLENPESSARKSWSPYHWNADGSLGAPEGRYVARVMKCVRNERLASVIVIGARPVKSSRRVIYYSDFTKDPARLDSDDRDEDTFMTISGPAIPSPFLPLYSRLKSTKPFSLNRN